MIKTTKKKQAEMAQRRTRCIELLLDGEKYSEIGIILAKEFDIKKTLGIAEIAKARTDILEWKNQNINEIIDTHIQRYEEMFVLCNESGLDLIAMRILKAKEKLIGFHKESRNIQINNNEMTFIDATHEPGKLPVKKQKRLNTLINKTRSNLWKVKNKSTTSS